MSVTCQVVKGFFTLSGCNSAAVALCPACGKSYCATHKAALSMKCIECASSDEQSDFHSMRSTYHLGSAHLLYHNNSFRADEVDSFERFSQDDIGEDYANDDVDLFDS